MVARGRVETGPERDYTAVVDVTDLQPATSYWYRFGTSSERSAVGRTRTLPSEDASGARASFSTSVARWPPGWTQSAPPTLPSARRGLREPLPPRPDDARYIRRWHKRRRFLVLALLNAVVGIVALAVARLARHLAAKLMR